MKQLKKILKKYNCSASLEYNDSSEEYHCSSFPDSLPTPIIDYIDCHYDVISRDRFSVTFKDK